MSSGGDANLIITGSARFEKLHAALNTSMATIGKLEDQLRRVTQESARGEKSQESMANVMTKRVAGMIAGYTSLQSVISLANRAMEKQLELQNRAMTSTMSLADAQSQLNNQMSPNATLGQFRQMAAMGQAAGVRAGIGEAQGLQSLAQIVGSTSGAWTPERMRAAVEMLEQGAPLFRGPNIQNLGRFGGAALALQRGVPGMSAQQSLGILGATLGQSVVENISNLENIIPPAIKAQQVFTKIDPLTATQQGLAIGAAISQRIFDPTGQKSGYAGTSLIATLGEQVPELVAKGMSPMEILSELRKPENAAKRAKVQKGLQGYLITKGAQMGFVTGDVTAIMGEEMLTEIQKTAGDPQSVRNWIERASKGTPEIATATQLRQRGAQQEAAVRAALSPADAVRRFLFGGEDAEGRYSPGELARLNRGTGMLGLADAAANLMRKGAFEAALLAGGTPLEAGQYVLSMLQSRDPERNKQVEDAMRALGRLPQEMTTSREAAEEQGKVMERGQNSAAAAAQRHAHAE